MAETTPNPTRIRAVAARTVFAALKPPVKKKSSANQTSAKPAASARAAVSASFSGTTPLPIINPTSDNGHSLRSYRIKGPATRRPTLTSRVHARALIDRLVDAFNRKDPAGMAALYQPDITYWSSISGYTRGSAEVIGHIRELFRHLPDEQMTPERVITNGSVIVVEFVSRGTGPEDRPYEIRFTEVMRLRDGLLAEIKVYIDPDEVPMPAAD